MQALAGDGVGGADVPGLVHDALQPQGLRDLDGAHGVAGVHLVGEEQDGDLAGTDVLEMVIKSFLSAFLWSSFSPNCHLQFVLDLE